MNEMTSVKRSRRNWSAQEQAQWLERFDRSGCGVRQFCEENGLSKTTLSYWRRRARKDASGARSTVVEVPRAQWSAPATPGTAVTMSLASGLEMHVHQGTDAAWLGAVVRALTNAGC